MLINQLIGKRFKEKPSEATLVSHSILLRGGYIRQVANGIYSLLPLGAKVIRKIENIIRQEMDKIGGQEVIMPVVLPKELWDESGRFNSVGSELVRFKDRTEHQMVLAMTHEEAVVHLVRGDINSYKHFPCMLYQIQTKFRDEPRSRGGLIRVREFTMKDAYSFHTTQESLQEYYSTCAQAYHTIFKRVGIPEVVQVESDTGMMGGRIAHEYMLLVDSGEDTIVKCNSCGYISNLEVAKSKRDYIPESEKPIDLIYTPSQQTIEQVSSFLKIKKSQIAKLVAFERDVNGLPVLCLIRGDLDINESKLSKIIGVTPEPASDATLQSVGVTSGYGTVMNINAKSRIVVDESVANSNNLVTGANRPDYHYVNFNLKRDVKSYETFDISLVKEGESCCICQGVLEFKRGIEVGNIFQLGTKYTQIMNMRYLDQEGKEKTPIMGCYGIGIGRLMASVIEATHDEYGPIWPLSIAPFAVELITLNLDDNQKAAFSDPIYKLFLDKGIDVLYDNRNERPGVMFADADLIGAPIRLIFSAKNFETKSVEWKIRKNSEKGTISVTDCLEFIEGFLKENS